MNAEDRCCYEFGSFRLDTAEHTLFHKGQAVHLTPKAVETLLVLVENHGHLVEKDELLEKVWEGSFVEESNVAKNIYMLRKVLSGNGLAEPIIETIPTRGYRFVTPLKETEVEAPQEVAVEIETPPEVEDPDRSNPPKTSSGRRGITAPILLVGIISMVAVLAVGGWYYLPPLPKNDGPGLETTHTLLSTDDEKVVGGVISPDGKLIVFRRIIRGGKPTLAVRRLATGETIDLGQDGMLATFTPDSKFIYYNRYEKDAAGVYRTPVAGGPDEKLMAGIYSPVAVSRDGNQLAFIRFYPPQTGGTIFVADKDGKNQKAISTIERTNFITQLVFSNDGQRVLIWEGESGEGSSGGHSAKWVNIDDKTVTGAKELNPLLEQNWRAIVKLMLLKDGSGFLFSGMKTVGRWDVFHLSIINGKITRIIDNGASTSVSDDGKTIALMKGGSKYSNMVSYDPVTKESRKIMNENRALVTWWGGFSQMPDGRILFSNGTEQGSDIYWMNKDGGNETRLTSDAGSNVNPVATPDGKYIVFRSSRSGAENLWRMDADGRNPVQLTNYSGKELGLITELGILNRSIQITNDGKTVFFAQIPNPNGKIKLMKILINGGEAVELIPNSQTSNYAPRISPDGKRLAYTGYVFDSKTSENKFAIYIRSLEGDMVGELEKKFDVRGKSQWTPDGKSLTYVKSGNLERENNIWKIDIATGKETALTSFAPTKAALQYRMFNWANDGKKILIVEQIWPPHDTALIRNRDISKKLY